MALKENYKDDILDVSQNVKRKYQMENNGDGTVSFTDVTEYTQQGDSFGASDMNATNGKVNTLESDIGEINDNLTALLNKVSYQSTDISTTTKYTDVENLITSSLADNKCPYIIAEFNPSGTIHHGVRLEYSRSGFGSTNNYNFAKALDSSAIFTMEVTTTETIARLGSTRMTFTNAKLYY